MHKPVNEKNARPALENTADDIQKARDGGGDDAEQNSGEDGEKGHTSGRTHTNTLTQTYTHVPLGHTHKYIERYLYTYDTSYLAQAYQLSTNC